MCGIVALIPSCAFPENRTRAFRRALIAIAHRGDGLFQNESLEFRGCLAGANRLAFTSGRARQPAESADGRFKVLLNGEIYPFHGLSSPSGENISDTQAIANFLMRNPIERVMELDGMYAIAVIDTQLGLLHLIRDRFGIKPVYYSLHDGSFMAASELKSIIQLNYFIELHHVEPGELVTLDIDNIRITKRIKVDMLAPSQDIECSSRSERVDALKKALLDSVANQTRDGHLYGIYLSGGVDSSAVYACALAAGANVKPIVLGNMKSEDKRYAELMASQGIVCVPCPSEEELLRILATVIFYLESFEPNVVRQSTVNWILTQGALIHGIRVALCGEGADELFGGYPEFTGAASPFGFKIIRERFLRDLHRTQLQRVDRINMAATIEVRVPFLSNAVADIALSTSDENEFINVAAGREVPGNLAVSNKMMLRKAMSTILPSQILNRAKVVLSEGAGVGSNDPAKGMFVNLIEGAVSNDLLGDIAQSFPDWGIRTLEEALYFQIFESFGYTAYTDSKTRVFANASETLTGQSSMKPHAFVA